MPRLTSRMPLDMRILRERGSGRGRLGYSPGDALEKGAGFVEGPVDQADKGVYGDKVFERPKWRDAAERGIDGGCGGNGS